MNAMRKSIGCFLAAAVLLTGGLALADEAKKAVGKVSIEEEQFGLILGGSEGTGSLTFEGKEYAFKLKGLSAGLNVGVSKMSAAGDVYELKSVADFPGTYTKAAGSVAVGGGIGGMRLQNEHGVIMDLRSRTKGLELNLGTLSGMTVTMEE